MSQARNPQHGTPSVLCYAVLPFPTPKLLDEVPDTIWTLAIKFFRQYFHAANYPWPRAFYSFLFLFISNIFILSTFHPGRLSLK